MAAFPAPHFASNNCEASPPYVRLPLIISESLTSAISSEGSSTQGIVSILLSGADLVKLDLSKLQLFSLDGFAAKPAASMVSSEQQTELKTLSNDDFTFPTPLVLSPVADLPLGGLAFPVLKSKGVVEAEKANAEHHLLKLGAISPSPRARKKAVSMDELSLNENLEDVVIQNVTGKSSCDTDIVRDTVRVRRQLPELELAPLPRPGSGQWAPLPLPAGLEQKAETLKKKHFERVLSRRLHEVRTGEAKIDLGASPAAKFLLQLMPWELTPPVTSITTPAAVPFIWEDVPGRPKPRAVPSPCISLPLPPRLVAAPPPSSSSTTSFALGCSPSDTTKFVTGDLPPSAGKPHHDHRHRKNMHSWHVLHNFFSGNSQQCPLQMADSVVDTDKGSDNSLLLRPEDVCFARGRTSTDGGSASSTWINSSSTSSELSPSIATPSEEKLSPCEASVSARYELPPLYVAPVTPLTPPYKGLGPLDEDDRSKETNRLNYLVKMFRGQKKDRFKADSFFNRFIKHDKVTSNGSSYLLNDAKDGHISSYGVHAYEQTFHVRSVVSPSVRKNRSVSTQLSPIVSNLYRSPVRGKHGNPSAYTSKKVFIKLRRRGARVIVASFKAIKRALFLKRARHSKLPIFSRLPYHALHR